MKDNPLYLFRPRLAALRNFVRARDGRSAFRFLVMAMLGLAFWAGSFLVFYRVLGYFRSTELIGDILAYHLMEMVFLALISVLTLSSIISALSTFYLSEEMQLILSSPATKGQVYLYKYVETLITSSWMAAVFGLPVFLSYGLVYGAGASFYAASFLVLALFMLIPAPVGMMITMMLVRTFPAKRAKDILVFMSLVIAVSLYFLIRFMQPEKLVNPAEFDKVAGYIASLKGPDAPYLPSYWAAKALWPVLTGGGTYDPFWAGMLASTAAAMFVIAGWVFGAIYMHGYSRAQEGGRYRTYGLMPSGKLLERLAGPARTPVKALVVKDIRTFFRDTAQWSQLLLLGSLVVVYVYNFKVLPIDKFPLATFFLKNFMSFLNLALAGFVIAAVAARLVFPAVSLERESFWILKASPLGLKGFLWAKFWSAWLPLLLLAEALMFLSNYFLRAGAFMTSLSALGIFFMTFGITGLGVGLGAVYPKFKYENLAQVSAGYGGIIYMLISMCFIGAAVTLLAWPVYMFFNARYTGVPESPAAASVSILCLAATVVLNVAACILPMKRGLASLERLEIL